MKKSICFFLVIVLLFCSIPAGAEMPLLSAPLDQPATISPYLDAASFASDQALSSAEFQAGGVPDSYKLGAGDKFNVHLIVGENALSLDYSFVVNPEGKIFFPNISEIYLSGLTLSQAKRKMEKEISRKYHDKFTLSLMMTSPKMINVYVTGQVDTPGLYTIPDSARLSVLLKKVGMAKGGSNLSESVTLKRKNDKGVFAARQVNLGDIFLDNGSGRDLPLMNGDILSVPAIKSYIYIYGDVARPGTFGYVAGQTLSDYINIAGGPTARASLSGVTVARMENGKPKVFRINASDILQRGVRTNDIVILAGDVINVPGNFFYFSDFGSFVNTILLGLTLYTTLRAFK